jgi:TPP-dependent 2-oxoacid decarboxylase
MSGPISHTQVYLDDPTTAAAEIDRAVTDAYIHARPVYIMIPTDMVPTKVSGTLSSYASLTSRQTIAKGDRLEFAEE